MKIIVKDMDIATGGIQVILINQKDAVKLDLHHGDRVIVKKGNKKTVAITDIAESKKAVSPGHIGLFEEVLDTLNVKQDAIVTIDLIDKPASLVSIRKKLDKKELTKEEINGIVKDIISNNLTEIELCYFISGCYTNGLSLEETGALAKAIVDSGEILNFSNGLIFDKHCIGGVPGNRTTMVVVPICVAAGLKFPKTSSRSITSPSGTADTMEVLAPVSVKLTKLKIIMKKVGGFIAWGGGMGLATADDKLIRLRHPLSLDPQGMLLASILAKKAAVKATHVLIDIPVGLEAKVVSEKKAKILKKDFTMLGKHLGMKIKVILSDGKEPIGHGIGPNLEARDVLWVLQNDIKAPSDLKRKSLYVTTLILKMAGVKRPKETARVRLESGLAYKKMQDMIRAQGCNPYIDPNKIKVGEFSYKVLAQKSGKIKYLHNKRIARIARIAGAPLDKAAGIYLNYHVGYNIKKGETVFIIYSDSKEKLKYAITELNKKPVFEIN